MNRKGIRIKKRGYIFIQIGEKYMPEHRIIAEQILGRMLEPEEKIHHIDFNKTNNKPSNLMLFPNQKEHSKFHVKLMQFPNLTNPMKREIQERSILNITKGLKTNK